MSSCVLPCCMSLCTAVLMLCLHAALGYSSSHAGWAPSRTAVDPPQQLPALGEAVGTVSRGMPKALIDALPRTKYTSRFPPGEALAPVPLSLLDPLRTFRCARVTMPMSAQCSHTTFHQQGSYLLSRQE